VAAFSADGVETGRIDGDNVGFQSTSYIKNVVGLRGGGAALGTWRYDFERDVALLEVQRLDTKLTKVGSVSWRRFQEDKPQGDATVVADDIKGCASAIVGGFTNGKPFAGIEDGTCQSPMRGW